MPAFYRLFLSEFPDFPLPLPPVITISIPTLLSRCNHNRTDKSERLPEILIASISKSPKVAFSLVNLARHVQKRERAAGTGPFPKRQAGMNHGAKLQVPHKWPPWPVPSQMGRQEEIPDSRKKPACRQSCHSSNQPVQNNGYPVYGPADTCACKGAQIQAPTVRSVRSVSCIMSCVSFSPSPESGPWIPSFQAAAA